jgi:serine/threonine-protein kinase RIO1
MSAWVLSPKPKQTTSLLDIMSEELVTKLSTAETPTTEVIDESSIPHYENLDFEIPIEEGEDIDSDLALALALQEIEELEHLHHLQQQEQQQHQNPSDQYSKINISHSPGEHLFPTRNRKGAAHDPLDEDDLDSGDSLITDHRILNNLKSFEQKRHQKGIVSGGRISGKDLKITSETVLDPTTRMILFKLIQNNKIDKLHGVIKTGKEANVYHGYRQPSSGNGGEEDQRAKRGGHESLKFNWNEETTDFAVKVFKTTLNEFSNRQDYFHGDHRFHGQKFTKGGTKESIAKVSLPLSVVSPTSLILSLFSSLRLFQWTEKEYRNLSRAYQAKLPVPQPIYFKENVLVCSPSSFLSSLSPSSLSFLGHVLSRRELFSDQHHCLYLHICLS